MSYDQYEILSAVATGNPIFLYQFARGSNPPNYLVAMHENLVYAGIPWQASSVSHNVLEQTGNVERNELELEFPIQDSFAYELLQPQAEVMTLSIFRAHLNDPDQERRLYWKGRVVGATSGGSTIVVKTENVFTSMRRTGCRVRVQRTCRHDHYGPECGVNKDLWAVGCTITSITGLQLIIYEASSYTERTFEAGMVKWGNLYGFVARHVGSTVTLVTEIPNLEEALALGPQSALLYHGCDRSLTNERGCKKFGNQLNFGGFRWIPNNNPFESSIV